MIQDKVVYDSRPQMSAAGHTPAVVQHVTTCSSRFGTVPHMCSSAISTACSIPASRSQHCKHTRLGISPGAITQTIDKAVTPVLFSHTLESRQAKRRAGWVRVAAAELDDGHFSQGVKCAAPQPEPVIQPTIFEVRIFVRAPRHTRLTTLLPAFTHHSQLLSHSCTQTFRADILVCFPHAHWCEQTLRADILV